jgi:galactofuranose transport system permease protein
MVLALLLAFNALFTPNFLDLRVVEGRLVGAPVDIALNGVPVVLVALGMSLVIATGGIDLSVGSVMGLSAVIAALLIRDGAWGGVSAAAAALAIASLIGAAHSMLASPVGLPPVVATLISFAAVRGLAQTLTGGVNIAFNDPMLDSVANGALAGIPVPVFIATGIAALGVLLVRRHVLGPGLAALGSNPEAARRAGVPTRAVRTWAYVLCAALAGLAGLLAAGDIRTADPNSIGAGVELDAILAVVLGGASLAGGRPRLLGAIVGALLMQTLTVTLNMWDVRPGPTLVVKGALAVAACLLAEGTLRARLLSAPASA